MKNLKFLFGLILLISAISCNNKPKPEPMVFTGFTKMDKLGTIEGTADTTDWRCDDQWTKKEKSLFTDSFAENCKAVHYKAMFYPNPCRTKSTFYVMKDSGVRVELRIVDKNMNVIMHSDSIIKPVVPIDLSSFTADDTIRIYYKFITPDKCEYKGHGDILVNPYK